MTKLQAYISAILILVVGVGLAVLGTVTKNDILMGVGLGLIPSAAAALGIPRPQDAGVPDAPD